MRVLINGLEQSQVSVFDRGFLYGDGLFETMRVSGGRIPLLEKHLARLKRSCARLQMSYPGDEIFYAELPLLCIEYPNAILKIILTRGVSAKRGYSPSDDSIQNRILIVSEHAASGTHFEQSGVDIILCKYCLSRNAHLAGIKHLSMLDYVLASAELKSKPVQEGLLRDTEGFVIEGTKTNLFLIKGNKLYTPDLSYSGVEGVMRNQVLGIATHFDMCTEIGRVNIEALYAADEVFITNSTIGIWPVKKIENRPFEIGQYTRRLQAEVQSLFDLESANAL